MTIESNNVLLSPQVIYGIMFVFTTFFMGVCGTAWKLWIELHNQRKSEITKDKEILDQESTIKILEQEKESKINELNLKIKILEQEKENLFIKHRLEIQDKENQINNLQGKIEIFKLTTTFNVQDSINNRLKVYTETIEQKERIIDDLNQETNNKNVIIDKLQKEIDIEKNSKKELEEKLKILNQNLSENQQQVTPNSTNENENKLVDANVGFSIPTNLINAVTSAILRW